MNSRKTENLKPNFNNSIKAGFNALFDSKSSYVVIEHLSNSANFTVGEKNRILVDCIEIGRSPKCAISFSESEKTVSRLHAVIGKEEGNWVLYNKSTTNPTLLNDRPLLDKWYLKNNDVIQFSVEGPKVRFKVPEDNKVNTINLTQRLNLFREQALRPYKTALRVISTIVLLIMVTTTVALYLGHTALSDQEGILSELGLEVGQLEVAFQEAKELSAAQIAEIRKQSTENEAHIVQMISRISDQSRSIQRIERGISDVNEAMLYVQNKLDDDYYVDVVNLYNDIYYLQIGFEEIRFPDGTTQQFSQGGGCTGFLLDDGKLVTARHCIESWAYSPSELNAALTAINGSITGMVYAINAAGNSFEIPLESFVIPDKANDIIIECGEDLICTYAWGSFDIAFAQTDVAGSLRANSSLSTSLRVGNPLVVLGFPAGIGATRNEINPVFSQTTVARNGLQSQDGYFPFISVTNRNFAEGNSGGPVLYKKGESEYEVVGVISAGFGGAVGAICPIAAMY